ncbi:MAG: cobyrinate a,c-diamide synthase [Rhodospirillales bacterium]|nr:MAG: cobyrinate a,c-diamide synthase [Rhodospirillales bacterium]
MAHLLIAATQKSSGKTMFSTGLAAVLARRGMAVQPFKKGPDYIDPMWLGRAAGRACFNLDFHCMEEAEIIAAFCHRDRTADISLIEANKGLFDGVDLEGRDSNAALAALLGAPVILVLDTMGMTRGIAPLVLGYLGFDAGVHIAGVVLNKVGGPRHESKLRAALERYTDVLVLGAIGRDRQLAVPERHLGLIPANEADGADEIIGRMADIVGRDVDIERLVAIASTASGPSAAPAFARAPNTGISSVRLGIARDAAFGFYYPDDLDALERAGATLVPFDTLRDASLPAVDGLFIGGGFPETQMASLEANRTMRESIRAAIANGMPVYAECGGMMYLSQRLTWNGNTHEMCGALPGRAVMHNRPQGRGYVILEETGAGPWPLESSRTGVPARFPAHEFHYASLEDLPKRPTFAYRVIRGHGIDGTHDGVVQDGLLASFSHLRDVAGNRWAARFIRFVQSRKGTRGSRAATT